MKAGEFETNAAPFTRGLSEWLSALPVTFQEISGEALKSAFFKIENKKGRRLDLHLRPIAQPSVLTEQSNSTSIILWEDLWRTKQKIVQSRLKALLGISERIPARLTELRRLDRPTTLKFLEENHLQDAAITKYKYGLYLPEKHFRVLTHPPAADEILVAVATYARPRVFAKEGVPHCSFELVRFANLLNTTVVGGLDKLLSHFTKEHQPDDIMTYADLEWSTGVSYQKLGFAPQGDTPPQEFWVDPATMQRFYPHRLPDGITGENAREHGFVKIKNAGSRKFVKNFLPQIPPN